MLANDPHRPSDPRSTSGSPAGERKSAADLLCSTRGCCEPRAMKGYCVVHYVRYLRIVERQRRVAEAPANDGLDGMRDLLKRVAAKYNASQGVQPEQWRARAS